MMKSGDAFSVVTPMRWTSCRQARQRLRDAVLHLHLRVVQVGAEREGDGQRQRAVGGRLREHVEHALDAVHLLLERRRDGLGDDLRVGAGDMPPRTTTVGGTTPGYSLIGSFDQRQHIPPRRSTARAR